MFILKRAGLCFYVTTCPPIKEKTPSCTQPKNTEKSIQMAPDKFFPLDHEQIAQKFGLTYKDLSLLIYPDTNTCYKTFTIPKKNGEERTINAPKVMLLRIQQKLSEELTAQYRPKKGAHGFIKGRSIVTNAEEHIKKRYVFNIDLENFFGTIHFGRVRNLLMSAPFNYSHEGATILAQICCHNGVLPQGAPTSPIISNMICWKLDAQLQRLAHKNRCTYTRYADDITFSFNASRNKLPRSIVGFDAQSDDLIVGQVLSKIIKENGFSVNQQKVRLQGRSQRQEVTGITVNRGVNVKRSFIRQTRSMLHAWGKYGAVAAEHDYLSKYRKKDVSEWQEEGIKNGNGEFFIKVVKGRINYIQMVRGRDNEVYRKLAYQLTVVMGKPNKNFQKSREELATFVIDDLADISQGTGFLLEKVGLVTNEHVVSSLTHESSSLYEAYRYDEEKLKQKCRYIYSSKESDIAVLKLSDEMMAIKPYKIGDSKSIKMGDKVTVVGFPGFSPGSTPYINTGKIVSQRVLFGGPVWIVDVPINHGCSGGPVLNNKGEVIGIARCGAANNDGTNEANGFLPISILTDVVASAEYINCTLYADMLEAKPTIDKGKNIFVHNGKNYCRICYEGKVVSEVEELEGGAGYSCISC